MKTKVEGISILVAMGTSLVVLSLAFATLTSIGQSVDQASNIQRSTQLFFASESGVEAAFFHKNARGAGINFPDPTNQEIQHQSINATTQWTIEGRTPHEDGPINQNAIIVDILKEGQTFKIPFTWDPSSDPTQVSADATPNNTGLGGTDILRFTFYQTPDDIPNSTAKTEFEERYGFDSDAFDPLQNQFDFGDPGDEEILIDWSITRKNSGQGVQTFIPRNNEDCAGFGTGLNAGYVCEDDIHQLPSGSIEVSTGAGVEGMVLPGSLSSRLDLFWNCPQGDFGFEDIVQGGETCSDYQLTIRPLLKFNNTVDGAKVPGIPFQITLDSGIGNPARFFPRNYYTVVSDVTLEDFSQRIEIEIPERTSIGAFDYVIFD